MSTSVTAWDVRGQEVRAAFCEVSLAHDGKGCLGRPREDLIGSILKLLHILRAVIYTLFICAFALFLFLKLLIEPFFSLSALPITRLIKEPSFVFVNYVSYFIVSYLTLLYV